MLLFGMIASAMVLMRNSICRLSGTATAVVLLTAAAHACSVPVFRYALERWVPDAYHVTLTHHGIWDDQSHTVTNFLMPYWNELGVITLATRAERGTNAFTERPVLRLDYPAMLRAPMPVWQGPATLSNALRIVDSPARREIARRIVNGDSAVWLVLESGDAAQDEYAAATVASNIAMLQATLKLPHELDEIPPEDRAIYDTNVVLRFSMLRMARTNAAEEIFIRMLTSVLPDDAWKQGPVVFPIYGRGRALTALIGPNIGAQMIGGLGQFLVGPCTCVFKGDNPGIDMLIAANWDEAIKTPMRLLTRPVTLQGFEQFFSPDGSEPVPGASMWTLQPTHAGGRRVWYALAITGLGAAAVLTAATFVLLTRSKKSS
jgi:hypothetical protein